MNIDANIFFFFLINSERDHEPEGGAKGGRESQAALLLSMEPNCGLYLMTLDLKPRAGLLN